MRRITFECRIRLQSRCTSPVYKNPSKWVNGAHSLMTRGMRILRQSNEAKTFDCRIRLQPPCAPPVWSHGGQTEWKLVRKEVGLRLEPSTDPSIRHIGRLQLASPLHQPQHTSAVAVICNKTAPFRCHGEETLWHHPQTCIKLARRVKKKETKKACYYVWKHQNSSKENKSFITT